jgi:hypothetical protein
MVKRHIELPSLAAVVLFTGVVTTYSGDLFVLEGIISRMRAVWMAVVSLALKGNGSLWIICKGSEDCIWITEVEMNEGCVAATDGSACA